VKGCRREVSDAQRSRKRESEGSRRENEEGKSRAGNGRKARRDRSRLRTIVKVVECGESVCGRVECE
jgi:hypothetical protein